MGKKFYQSREFKELADEWNERLEKEGLPDIEKQVGGRIVLIQNSPNVYRQMELTQRAAKEIYFQTLSQCIHEARFDSEVDQAVMVLKSEGAKITEICLALAARGMRRYRRTVRLIIRKYEDRWGIRNWKPEQLKYSWEKKTPTP